MKMLKDLWKMPINNTIRVDGKLTLGALEDALESFGDVCPDVIYMSPEVFRSIDKLPGVSEETAVYDNNYHGIIAKFKDIEIMVTSSFRNEVHLFGPSLVEPTVRVMIYIYPICPILLAEQFPNVIHRRRW